VTNWVTWHEAYDDPSSSLSARLQRVRAHLSAAIDRAPAGPVRLVSLCAGHGHDVLGVLPGHPRRDDVRAVLVEADAANTEMARGRAAEAGLAQVEVRQADASRRPPARCSPSRPSRCGHPAAGAAYGRRARE
jgi:hypothetical protein